MNSYRTYTKSELNKRVPNRLTIILILVITCINSTFGGREGGREREREGGEGEVLLTRDGNTILTITTTASCMRGSKVSQSNITVVHYSVIHYTQHHEHFYQLH